MKQELDLNFESSFEGNADLENLLSGEVVTNTDRQSLGQSNANIHDDDECEMIGESVPRPLVSTMEGLLKRENDSITNSKPFIVTVSFCGR